MRYPRRSHKAAGVHVVDDDPCSSVRMVIKDSLNGFCPPLPLQVIQGIILFLTADYRKRYQAALALLTEMYATDVMGRELTFGVRRPVSATPSGAGEPKDLNNPKESKEPKEPKSATRKRRRGDGFVLYDRTLLALLTSLSKSLEVSSQQKLFTQTLLDCPRVPPPVLELVCSLCDLASHPHDVQTGDGNRCVCMLGGGGGLLRRSCLDRN